MMAEKKRSSLRRCFSFKKDRRYKQKILEEVLENQKLIWDKVITISRDQADALEKTENHRRRCKCQDRLEDSERELKQKLEHQNKNDKKMIEDMKGLERQNHQLDLNLVRLKMENQQLISDKTRSSEELKSLQESVNVLKSDLDQMRKQKADIEDDSRRRSEQIRDLEWKLDDAAKTKHQLEEQLQSKDEAIHNMEMNRSKLLIYLKRKSCYYEHQLEAIQSQLRKTQGQKYISDREAVRLTATVNNDENLVTKMMEADFKVYRRDKLIEVLSDKLRQYEEDFDITAMTEYNVYLDTDFGGRMTMSGMASETGLQPIISESDSSKLTQ